MSTINVTEIERFLAHQHEIECDVVSHIRRRMRKVTDLKGQFPKECLTQVMGTPELAQAFEIAKQSGLTAVVSFLSGHFEESLEQRPTAG